MGLGWNSHKKHKKHKRLQSSLQSNGAWASAPLFPHNQIVLFLRLGIVPVFHAARSTSPEKPIPSFAPLCFLWPFLNASPAKYLPPMTRLISALLAFFAVNLLASPPRVTLDLPDGALPIPPGPVEPTWESLRAHYQTPA